MVFNEDYHINMLMSNKDVYIRFDKFRTGEINKLLIPGLSGSGKSTLSRELAQRFNCPCIELDKFRGNIYYTDEEIKRDHPYIYKYFKTEFTKGDRHNIAKMEPEERKEEFEKFIYWLLKQPERMVIEGALEKILYDNDDMRKTYPMVFKGTSMLKSMARMSWREFHRDHPGRDPIDNLLWWMKWCTKYKKMTDQHNKVREKIMGDVNMDDYEEREENDLPLIMEAMGYKPHPIVFSDDDVYINYNKWKSGECTSLLVTGLSGGGKSSLSKKLADKFNAYYVEIDVISFKIGILKPQRANWEYIQKNDKYLYKFLKENNFPPTIMQQFKNYQDPKKSTIIDKYIYWLCFERDDLDTKRVVIEGGDVAISLTNIKELSNLPIIIKGTSLAKSLFRRMNRTLDQGDDIWYILKRVFDGTYVSQYSKMYPEVDNARKSVMDQEYEELDESYGYKPQPILFSDDDVYINYNKWKSGEYKSVLITSISGSGKSTLAKKIAEKFNAYYVEIDVLSFGLLKPQKANWNYIQENDKYLYKFLKENNLTPTLMLNFKDHPQNKKKVKILDKYIHWLCFERDDLDENRVVIAGSDVAASLIHMKELAEFPIIIKGTSIAKSSYRKIQRTLNKGHDIGFILDHILNSNYFSMYRYRVPEINSARQAVMNQEYEEIHESFVPELIMYHGSSHKFDKVKPISFSAGNKLRDPSWVVFMLRQYDLALSYVVGNYVKEKCEENGIKYSFCAWIEKDGFMHYKPIVLADKQNFQKVKDLVRGDTVYVYTLKVPIDDKLNMIGTTNTLPEYVYSGVPKTIKRDDIVITDELLDSLVTDQIDEKEFQKIKKSKPHRLNRIGSWADLFIDMDKRKEMRDKVLPKIDSGEIKPGDDLSWLKESANIQHTFTHKELCDIYQNQMITENSAIYIPHESGNITQNIPGAYFNEEVGVWMRKPNKEELYKLRLIEAGYDPKTGKIIYSTESDDKFLEVFEADEKEWLKKVYYKSFPNIRAGVPQPVIDIKGHKFRPRCEVIIIDGDKALIDPLSNRGEMGYSCPGGGIDPNESIADGAKRECEEEARVIPKDIIYTGLAWTLEFKTKSIAYFGSISFICVATKKKDYKGYVKVVDRDKFVDNATWVPISNLSEPHQMAIARYKNLYLQESLGINMEFLNNEYV